MSFTLSITLAILILIAVIRPWLAAEYAFRLAVTRREQQRPRPLSQPNTPTALPTNSRIARHGAGRNADEQWQALLLEQLRALDAPDAGASLAPTAPAPGMKQWHLVVLEEGDQRHSRDETSDVRTPGNAAITTAARGGGVDDLQHNPQTQHD